MLYCEQNTQLIIFYEKTTYTHKTNKKSKKAKAINQGYSYWHRYHNRIYPFNGGGWYDISLLKCLTKILNAS